MLCYRCVCVCVCVCVYDVIRVWVSDITGVGVCDFTWGGGG